MKCILPVKEAHQFRDKDYVGGHAALDFVNTVTGRNGSARDWLVDAPALVGWAIKAGIITEDEGSALLSLTSADRTAAEEAFHRALELREAIYLLLDAVTSGKTPPAESLTLIESGWRSAASGAHVRWAASEGLSVETPSTDLDVIAERLAFSFVELGSRLSSDRLRKCVGRSCAWFFLDTSKGGRRRWCDMAACGNAAKYVRARAAGRTMARPAHEGR